LKNPTSSSSLEDDLNRLLKAKTRKESFQSLLVSKYGFEVVNTNSYEQDYVRSVSMILTGGFSQKEWLTLFFSKGVVIRFERRIAKAAF
jgi:hypothetical protein